MLSSSLCFMLLPDYPMDEFGFAIPRLQVG